MWMFVFLVFDMVSKFEWLQCFNSYHLGAILDWNYLFPFALQLKVTHCKKMYVSSSTWKDFAEISFY